jgi:hypothetical protein
MNTRLQGSSRETMTVVAPNQAPDQPASAGPPHPDDKPVLPVKSQEDTDTGWGEQAEPDDDERLYRERPPHWDST